MDFSDIDPNSRSALRDHYCDVFHAMQQGSPLIGEDAHIAEVITMHPEYHRLLKDPERAEQIETDPTGAEANPFLHMGLHLTLREQLRSDQPRGIRKVHRQLVNRLGDPHEAEHRMAEVLASSLWEAAQGHRFNDNSYLKKLRRLRYA